MTSAAAFAARFALIRVASRRAPCTLSVVSTDVRWFSRKGAKMGHHLETLDEMAHKKAKEKRKAKKQQTKEELHDNKKYQDTKSEMELDAVATSSHLNDINEAVEFDEGDDIFTTTRGDGDEEELPELPKVDDVKNRMLKVVTRLTDSFKAIRGNEPTPEIFDPIMVVAYGERTPLNAVAQVVITSPTLVTITCFDPSVAPEVRNAVQLALELSPQLEDDGVITVKMPRPTLESRQKTVKLLGKQAESGRQRIRGIRRAAMDIVKKGKDGKLEGISKDDAFRVSKEIDAVTDQVTQQLNEVVAKKQESVLQV
jgi:ribosome recycling factor